MGRALELLVTAIIEFVDQKITIQEYDKKKNAIYNAYEGNTGLLYSEAYRRAKDLINKRKI